MTSVRRRGQRGRRQLSWDGSSEEEAASVKVETFGVSSGIVGKRGKEALGKVEIFKFVVKEIVGEEAIG